MPLISSSLTLAGELLLWKTDEETELLEQYLKEARLPLNDNPEYRSEKRRKEWMICRLLHHYSGVKDQSISYTPQGKPVLSNGKFISFSHSEQYCALLVSDKNCGVDIEEHRPALEKVKHKFLSETELLQLPANADERIEYLQWCWGIKESILKITGDKNFDYANQIHLKSVNINQKKATASYILSGKEQTVNCHLIKSPHYYLVCVTE